MPRRGKSVDSFPNLLDYFAFEVHYGIRFDGTQGRGGLRADLEKKTRPFPLSFPYIVDGDNDPSSYDQVSEKWEVPGWRLWRYKPRLRQIVKHLFCPWHSVDATYLCCQPYESGRIVHILLLRELKA